MMNMNVGKFDRAIRVLIGGAMILYALLSTNTPYAYLGWIGIVPLATGMVGWCGLYKLLGISTA